ncbi:hypothetical protein XELAEV_18017131mg [Xenopus laevis]|uniref:Uncharacterized protein n=1 Tax=Xenopus laevis TaxID=8355 RepID=A0A974HSD6_XENLA|nr:hypothetical protein XELAEV_18017131mg [Xenopus laevis]
MLKIFRSRSPKVFSPSEYLCWGENSSCFHLLLNHSDRHSFGTLTGCQCTVIWKVDWGFLSYIDEPEKKISCVTCL